VFLLGNWRNYDELEGNLSIEEIIATLNAYRKRQREDQRFLAAIQGIDLSKEDEIPVNVTDMTSYEVSQSGFGIGMGLGHSVQNVSEGVSVN